nr:PREDICTED: X-ray repair cross-complementing protein 5-like [Bemisia tabaci]
MPPRKKKIQEAVVIILDVGYGGENAGTSSSKSFFEKGKECVIGLIKKKIFSKSQELVSLILMNSEETLNDLNAREDGYENIKLAFPLREASWQIAKTVADLKPTEIDSVDALDAMAVALNYIQQEQQSDECVKLSNMVVISRFAGATDTVQANSILRQLKSMASELTIIGYGVDEIQEVSQQVESSQERSLRRLHENLAVISSMVSKMNSYGMESSALCSFEDILSHLLYFKGKSVRPTAWRVDLEIGRDIQIEVVGYKLVAEQERFEWTTQKKTENTTILAKDSENGGGGIADAVAGTADAAEGTANAGAVITEEPKSAVYRDIKAYMDVDDQGDEREVAPEDIVKSYVYGDKIIPFPTHDSETMAYESGPRSLKLIGFTKQRNVPKYILQGNGVNVLTCGKNSGAVFAALHKVLEAQQLVGIVRRVYNRNNAPAIGTLYPEVVDGKKVLTFIELPFAGDVITLKFPSLSHVNPTSEQKNAINKLIDTLDLSNPDDPDDELFHPEKTYDPDRQLMYHKFAQQILYPEDSSQSELPDHIEKLTSLPNELKEKAEPVIEDIKQVFPLVEIERKQWKKGRAINGKVDDEPDDGEVNDDGPSGAQTAGISSIFKPTVVQVTAIHPVKDFETLIQRGEDHTEVCNQLKKVILNLAKSIKEKEDLLKVIAALKTLRKSCLGENPALYNSWLREFKTLVQERDLKSVWEKIEEEKLGLISNKETANSDISEEDSFNFLQLASAQVEQELDVDMDDL